MNNLRELFNKINKITKLRIGVAQKQNEVAFKILNSIYPLKIKRFKSGLSKNGWVIPKNLEVVTADIRKNHKIVYNGKKNILGVIANSNSFNGKICGRNLKKHLFFSKRLKGAVPFHCIGNYRPWVKNWGFCVPKKVFDSVRNNSLYQVNLKIKKTPSSMIVGESVVPGMKRKTFIFNAHTCHPGQFEDGYCGIGVILTLLKHIEKIPKRQNTYKAVFAPEHLGSFYYVDRLPRQQIKDIHGTIFMEMLGLKTPFAFQESFFGKSELDRAFLKAFEDMGLKFRHGKFREILGNDETVWEAPGIEIPCVSFSRCYKSPFYYKEYHTDQDIFSEKKLSNISQALKILKYVIFILENNFFIKLKTKGLISLANPIYNLYNPHPDPTCPEKINSERAQLAKLQDKIFRYMDGSLTILDLAIIHQIKFTLLLDYLLKLSFKNIISLK